MPNPASLKEVYANEMKDLWSANDQMARAVQTMSGRAHGPELKKTLLPRWVTASGVAANPGRSTADERVAALPV